MLTARVFSSDFIWKEVTCKGAIRWNVCFICHIEQHHGITSLQYRHGGLQDGKQDNVLVLVITSLESLWRGLVSGIGMNQKGGVCHSQLQLIPAVLALLSVTLVSIFFLEPTLKSVHSVQRKHGVPFLKRTPSSPDHWEISEQYYSLSLWPSTGTRCESSETYIISSVSSWCGWQNSEHIPFILYLSFILQDSLQCIRCKLLHCVQDTALTTGFLSSGLGGAMYMYLSEALW